MKKILFAVFFLICSYSFGQEKKSGSEYVKINYPNGKISSEGLMVDGKPEGYWKTFYVTGVLKSEGNRKNHLLDSIWVFYNEIGDTTEKLNYVLGKKNGYYERFDNVEGKNNPRKNVLISKELYVNDKREGQSFYYYPSGKLHEVINFKNNRRHGVGKEFDEDGNIITLYEFFNDYLTEKLPINRTVNGLKQGRWKDFYENGKVKAERNYKNDVLSGYSKEYDKNGNVSLALLYNEGKLVENSKNDSLNLDEKIEYSDDGKIIKKGYYRNGVPIGIHREYDADGKVINSYVYNEQGIIVSKGIVNEDGTKEGPWAYFFEDGEVKSEGLYKNNRQSGEWKFYFKGGLSEQKGSFDNGLLNGVWQWFYNKGQVLRIENFVKGSRDGPFYEFDENGDTIVKGTYIRGEKNGQWKTNIGNVVEIGNYIDGLKEGIWKTFYPSGNLKYIGNYIQGNADGKHIYYFDDGKVREEQEYVNGIKEKYWKKYLSDGTLLLTITYENDTEVKINGIKIDRRRL